MSDSSNFGFLGEHSSIFLQLATAAERAFAGDPNSTLIKLRQLASTNPESISGENSAQAKLKPVKRKRKKTSV